MRRILEPEVMDTRRDAEEYDEMDFWEADTRFAEDAIALLGAGGGYVLDLGTGTGKIPALMLQRHPGARVVAVDLAHEMLRVAAWRVGEAGVADRCQLLHMDAKQLALPDATFDLVMCNSTAHHIPEPERLFREIARLVRPGGGVIVRDLQRPETTGDAAAIVERVAAGDHPRQRQLFYDSLCASLTLDDVQRLVDDAGLDRMRIARCSDRHWTAERANAGARAARRAASVRPSG